jgi:mannose-6-phosphate isomerase-like protein (cupin superfamily)
MEEAQMTKTMAKLQARAKKTSRKKTSNMRRGGAPVGTGLKPAPTTRGKKTAAAAVRAGLKAAPPKPPRKQTFHFSNFRAEDFRTDGLRTYAKYRDLGMSAATSGLLQAHVIRLVPPCDPAVVSKRHYHDVELQMIYVLKGWIKGEYDGEVVTLREGAAWLQPPRIEHRVLDYSDDCELLEIVVPANFKTVELE